MKLYFLCMGFSLPVAHQTSERFHFPAQIHKINLHLKHAKRKPSLATSDKKHFILMLIFSQVMKISSFISCMSVFHVLGCAALKAKYKSRKWMSKFEIENRLEFIRTGLIKKISPFQIVRFNCWRTHADLRITRLVHVKFCTKLGYFKQWIRSNWIISSLIWEYGWHWRFFDWI